MEDCRYEPVADLQGGDAGIGMPLEEEGVAVVVTGVEVAAVEEIGVAGEQIRIERVSEPEVRRPVANRMHLEYRTSRFLGGTVDGADRWQVHFRSAVMAAVAAYARSPLEAEAAGLAGQEVSGYVPG